MSFPQRRESRGFWYIERIPDQVRNDINKLRMTLDSRLRGNDKKHNKKMSNRIKLTVSYKGTNYHGWQSQPQGNTIQQILEEALREITKEKVNLVGTSRTDAGVHALEQICHFDWPGQIPESIKGDPQKLSLGINSLIPYDISIIKSEIVSHDFNCQRNIDYKEYIYHILISQIKNPFLQEYSWRIPHPLNIPAMKEACNYLIGYHNFKSFCASDTNVKTFERNLLELSIEEVENLNLFGLEYESHKFRIKSGMTNKSIISKSKTNHHVIPDLIRNQYDIERKNQMLLQFKFKGKGFLKQMIRNIMGSLIEVGKSKQKPEWIKELIAKKDRTLAGACAPAKGLILSKVNFLDN